MTETESGPTSAMIAALSLTCVAAGTLIACGAERYPRHRATIEIVAGIMLICGFGLLGYGLGCIFGPP
jgi:hypothetical protein